MLTWNLRLRKLREAIGVSQAVLAQCVHVSPETIRAYEAARRAPTQPVFERIVAELKVPNETANHMREALGFPRLMSNAFKLREESFYFNRDEANGAVEALPWPAFIVNDAMEIVAANSLIQSVWGVDFATEAARRGRVEMNLLAIAGERRFAEKAQNWDEIVLLLASLFKANAPDPYSFDEPTAYFNEVLESFVRHDGAYVARLIELWNRAEPMEPKIRFTYPIQWRADDGSLLRFECIANIASEPDALFFNDWIPLDGDTWFALRGSASTRRPA